MIIIFKTVLKYVNEKKRFSVLFVQNSFILTN